MNLYARLRSRTVLHRAWAKVRSSGLKPNSSEKTKKEIIQFDKNWLNNLERLGRLLKNRAFVFKGEKGVALPKGKGKSGYRPLVVAPIENRIIRRAILDVLQGYESDVIGSHHKWEGIPAIRTIMDTRTSIGGVSRRGVSEGIALVDQAVRGRKEFFIRSDIRNFFTRIPKADISDFISTAVCDEDFSDLFDRALATNLENQVELEERNIFKLFPDAEIGVAQGSALSALAGNIALRDFDASMNGRGIVCVRYIDDFILLGSSESKVGVAYQSARSMLKTMGMDVYGVDDIEALKSGKVAFGNIHKGTDFLGYRISAHSYQPCKAAQRKFIEKIDEVAKDTSQAMKIAVKGRTLSSECLYHHAMVELHKIIWGWSQSFRHTTAKHVFEQLDKEIDKRINKLQALAHHLIPSEDTRARRRVMGVHLLADTKTCPLPELKM